MTLDATGEVIYDITPIADIKPRGRDRIRGLFGRGRRPYSTSAFKDQKAAPVFGIKPININNKDTVLSNFYTMDLETISLTEGGKQIPVAISITFKVRGVDFN
ncbi:MAG: hypothetical protein WDN66_03190 [Candidatus Saccharibacteria bacterium]